MGVSAAANGSLCNVSVRGLSYEVQVDGSPKPILDNINLEFPQGINGIMGPTGAGKSSLIDVIAQRVTHQAGR